MLKTIFIVGTGGFIGSVMRYLIQFYFEKVMNSTFPMGTLFVNIVGSFIIGMVFAIAEKGNLMSSEWRIFLVVGICGGFTTFSAFSYNTFIMLKEHSYGQMFLNVSGNLVLGILAVYLGIILIRAIF